MTKSIIIGDFEVTKSPTGLYWTVKYNGRAFDQYATRREAIDCAEQMNYTFTTAYK